MPNRDYDNYLHLTIQVKKGSATHRGLLKDAAEIGTKMLPTVAVMRLADYYRSMEIVEVSGEPLDIAFPSFGSISSIEMDDEQLQQGMRNAQKYREMFG